MKPAGRPKKVRYVKSMPQITQFSPRGRPGRPDEIELSVDQFEAVKLADFEGLDQSQGANAIGVSRPSFGRILREARHTLADAIINGKIIRIQGGNVELRSNAEDQKSVTKKSKKQ